MKINTHVRQQPQTARPHGFQIFATACLALLISVSTVSAQADSQNRAAQASAVLIAADFEQGSQGFSFESDLFRGTNQPNYSGGVWTSNRGLDGGGLLIALGGIDGQTISGISGGWRLDFTVPQSANVTLSFSYKMNLEPKYENDEYSEVLVSLDALLHGQGGNEYIARIFGDSTIVEVQTTGWQSAVLDLGPLSQGQHALVLGGFNNQKTSENESTEILLDNVILTTETSNQPPTVTSPIPDTTLVLDQDVLNFDLNSVFRDPDGDTLEFSVTSQRPGVASSSLRGDQLTITPNSPGKSRMTIDASDGQNPEVRLRFEVTVVRQNSPPVVAITIPDTVLSLPGEAFEIDLLQAFADPDGDNLTFNASNSNGDAVIVQLIGPALRLTPSAVGNSRITVQASDGLHPPVSQEFSVTVTQENRAPRLVRPLPDTTLLLQGSTLQEDLLQHFSDPDSDRLFFRVDNADESVVAASLNGSSLNLSPRATGSTIITVTAFDPQALQAFDSFEVTVTNANRPPEITKTIPDTTLSLDGPEVEADLTQYFADPDGDNLTFTASSSDAGIVSAGLSDNLIRLTAAAVGEAEITIRASDGENPEVTTQFQAVVVNTNRPPEIASQPRDTTLSLGAAGVILNLATVFRDPEADQLSFAARSSNETVLSVNLAGTQLSFDARSVGQASVTVSAKDNLNPEVSATFDVLVASNRPPVVQNPISPVTLDLNGDDFNNDLREVFLDPEQDNIFFTASSSNDAVAVASLAGPLLSVSPVSEGSVTIHLTATDMNSPEVNHVFGVTVQGANQAPAVVAGIPDTTIFVGGPNLRFDLLRTFSDPDGDLLTFTATSSQGQIAVTTIRDSVLTVVPIAEGQAAIATRASDGRGGSDSTKFLVEVSTYPTVVKIRTAVSYPRRSGAESFSAEEYRLFGMPGADNRLISQLFAGEQNDTWQVYWDNGKSRNYFVAFDGSENFRMTPGRAFWVIHNGPWHINVDAPSAPLSQANEVAVHLHPGFNLITNPFATNINWASVQALNGIAEPIWAYDGNFHQTAVFAPNAGYYLFNRENLAELRIPFGLTLPPTQTESGDKAVLWHATLVLSSDKSTDALGLGVATDASAALDRRDHFKPRAIDDTDILVFHRPEWDVEFDNFASDFRPPFPSLESWDFHAGAGTDSNARLLLTGTHDIPQEFDVLLVDLTSGRASDLRKYGSSGIQVGRNSHEFRLLIGTPQAAASELKQIVPSDFLLEENYPNPFNPTTTIPVVLPGRMDVSLTIYNVLGQQVNTLHRGSLNAGRHLFVWDGRDLKGAQVSSGVYVYKLESAGGGLSQKRMLLLK